MNRFIYKHTKYVWIFFLIAGMISLCPQAALGEEKAGSMETGLWDIGRSESKLAKTTDPYTKYLIEAKWRREINEIGIQLEKKGVKISKEILDAIIKALGIDEIGPFIGRDLRGMGFPLPPIDPELVAEYEAPVEDLAEEAAPETKEITASSSS